MADLSQLAEQLKALGLTELHKLASILCDDAGTQLNLYLGDKPVVVHTDGGTTCDDGYHYDTVLKRCVLDGD